MKSERERERMRRLWSIDLYHHYQNTVSLTVRKLSFVNLYYALYKHLYNNSYIQSCVVNFRKYNTMQEDTSYSQMLYVLCSVVDCCVVRSM